MKKYYILFSILIIQFIYTSYSFTQNSWVVQNSGVTESFWSVDFINENTGFICGTNGIILKTINGGSSWTSQYLGSGFLQFVGIDFINSQTGWVTGSFGFIYNTTNGGTTWNSQNSNINENLFFVEFINPNTGYISCDAGVLKTTNAGVYWGFSFFSVNPVYSVYFLNENNGWFGDNTGNQYLTTNSGTTWTLSENIAGTGNISHHFINQSTGWAVGYNNKIIKTTNGGYNWVYQSNNLNSSTQLRDVEFIANSPETGWVVGYDNSVLKTTNGGNNWITQPTPANRYYTSIDFVNSTTGFIVGHGGIILKTTNGGLTTINTVSNVPDSFSLSQNYPNPFNPSTNIKFSLPNSGNVSLKIYDNSGKEVAELITGFRSTGTYEISFDASQLSSGIYYYKLTAYGESGEYTNTKKMSLIK